MNTTPKTQALREQALMKLYMDLTGARESEARNVLMYLRSAKGNGADNAPDAPPGTGLNGETKNGDDSELGEQKSSWS
ncbi:hypothetical protein SBV1_890036 [Verrucomicrobia bacterium]|nr:hypothetical protein SBV1_890036 [Verrucomicrobiota bacterium]